MVKQQDKEKMYAKCKPCLNKIILEFKKNPELLPIIIAKLPKNVQT